MEKQKKVDCGNGTSRQMAFADIPLKSLGTIFITHHEDVGKVARDAGVKTLVLTHYVPVDDPTLTDEIWMDEIWMEL